MPPSESWRRSRSQGTALGTVSLDSDGGFEESVASATVLDRGWVRLTSSYQGAGRIPSRGSYMLSGEHEGIEA
jgi:hypothetical protein